MSIQHPLIRRTNLPNMNHLAINHCRLHCMALAGLRGGARRVGIPPCFQVTRTPQLAHRAFAVDLLCFPRPTFCNHLPTKMSFFSKNKPPSSSPQERKSCYNYNGRRHSHLGEMDVLFLAFDWIGDAHLISGVRWHLISGVRLGS